MTYFEFWPCSAWKQATHQREVCSYTTQKTVEFLRLWTQNNPHEHQIQYHTPNRGWCCNTKHK